MASRTVRLDDEAERALRDIRRRTGMTISEALKKGLLVLQRTVSDRPRPSPWEIYEKIDLGEGGYAVAPAKGAKRAAREAVERKHRR
jgi:hypothetical protein